VDHRGTVSNALRILGVGNSPAPPGPASERLNPAADPGRRSAMRALAARLASAAIRQLWSVVT
jgi:hypothetical protein